MSNPAIIDDIDPLTRLAIKYGTDKWGLHFYTPLYHELFSRLRYQPIRLLEIGVGGYGLKTAGGASLAMWADYFSNGQITGVDIDEKRLALNPRVKFFQGSQDDAVFLKRVYDERGPFDIIIDDGSHVPKHVVTSFHILFPSLVDGGIYLIEDVQTAFWPSSGGSLLHGGETLKLARLVLECLNHAEIAIVDRSYPLPTLAKKIKAFRAFHNVIVIDKGDNSEPSSHAYDLKNPYAIRAAKTMERELERAPTGEGMANLTEVYLRGGNLIRAKEIADKALSLWPENVSVLVAACRVATAQKEMSAKFDYLKRILKIEPDNTAIHELTDQTRAGLEQLDHGSPG
jgi:hypothetical protein